MATSDDKVCIVTTLGFQQATVLHKVHIDELKQERCNSSALAMQLRLPCINPSIYSCMKVEFLSHKHVKSNDIIEHVTWQPLQELLSRYPLNVEKSVQLI